MTKSSVVEPLFGFVYFAVFLCLLVLAACYVRYQFSMGSVMVGRFDQARSFQGGELLSPYVVDSMGPDVVHEVASRLQVRH
jgi:hypothetical protein